MSTRCRCRLTSNVSICSFIDQLPFDLNSEVSSGSELVFAEASGLLQGLDGLVSEHSRIESTSGMSQDERVTGGILLCISSAVTGYFILA